jgi:DNA uptake protein ComE-like DNA-binding protein
MKVRLKSEIRNPKSEFQRKHVSGTVSNLELRNSFGFGYQTASTFIIVLWIAFGLVSITLYFAHAMSLELRAADNRVSGLESEQAIEGAVRYVGYILASLQTNGAPPDSSLFLSEAVPVGEAHFWLIARDTNNPAGGVGTPQLSFGLMDEASKLNLNTAPSNMVAFLPRMTTDLASRILDWRNTNGATPSQTYYAMQHPPYQCKNGTFETVEELRLVIGSDADGMDMLIGEDSNLNGILDPNETDDNHNGQADPGLLEYVTVYSREPGTYSNGVPRINVNIRPQLVQLLQQNFSGQRLAQITNNLGPALPVIASPLQFYIRSRMKPEEFAQIADAIKVSNSTNNIEGRINVNSAMPAVLACLPGISASPDLAQTLVSYRLANPDKLTSIAWLADALSGNKDALTALQAVDCVTIRSYQFSADVAALGPHGRGYRRVRFVFDTLDGSPKIIYRRDLSHLGWALGKDIRQTWLAAKATP